MGLPVGTHVWIAAGFTDMGAGFNGLTAKVELARTDDPFSGHELVFRRRRGNVIKLPWSTGDGLCLLSKRLEHGRFVLPQATSGTVRLIRPSCRATRRYRLETPTRTWTPLSVL
jgi:transposase